MSNRTQISVNLTRSDAKKLKALLKESMFTESPIVETKNSSKIIKGTGTTESVRKLSGVWSENKERLTANEIRKQAWQRNERASSLRPV
jgi:hypothetical protein